MKYLAVLFIMLSGCVAKGVNTTIFLKEDSSRLYNLNGDDCLESGYQVIKTPNGKQYRLTYYYSNCDIHKDRILKEFEIKHWAPSGTIEIQR